MKTLLLHCPGKFDWTIASEQLLEVGRVNNVLLARINHHSHVATYLIDEEQMRASVNHHRKITGDVTKPGATQPLACLAAEHLCYFRAAIEFQGRLVVRGEVVKQAAPQLPPGFAPQGPKPPQLPSL